MASTRRLGVRPPDYWPALALAVLASGCTLFQEVKPSRIEQAPSFSPTAVAGKGVVIGAVACSRSESRASESSSNALGSQLRASLRQKRPEMAVLMPEDVERALGAEAYREWSQYFQDTGVIRTKSLPEIFSALRGSAGYVLLARIEADEITRRHGDHEVSRDGRFVTEGEEYVTSRTTEMLFRLYDLETSTMEWKGHFETTKQLTNVEEDEELALQILEVVFDEDEESPYPTPASLDFQTGQIFEEFAETLLDPD
jgi:hypothetical protein